MKLFNVLAASVALATLSLPALAQDVTLRVSNWLPVSHPIVKDILMPWADQVTQATEGRVAVQILDAPLGPPPAHYDLVSSGAADVAISVHGYTPGRFVLTELQELPFLTPSAEVNSVAFWRVWEEMLAGQNEHAGVKVLALFGHGAGHLFTTNRPITPVSGLQGAKIRVAGEITNQLVTNLGMVSLQAPSSESYELLHNGVADGIVFPYESIPFFKLENAVKNALTVDGGMYNVSFFMVMNQAKYDSLSDADRAAIDSVSGETLARMAGRAWDEADKAGLELLQDKVQFTAAEGEDLAALQSAADTIYKSVADKYQAKGVDFDAALDMFKAEIARVEAGE